MSNTITRFSNRVENYVKYRPGYPKEVLKLFRSEMGLIEASVIADIGSGTGISSKLFLENGNEVFAVEPNRAMRESAEESLSHFAKFHSIDGVAENTGLSDKSIDFVVAAQAFHWFDAEKTRSEFQRILRANGFIVLIWNERQLNANQFLREYESFLLKFANDYSKVRHDNVNEKFLTGFFTNGFHCKSFQNEQALDFEGLKGRVLSSSYMPSETDPLFEPMAAELRSLFAKHAENGKIKVSYDTNIFYSQVELCQ